MSHHAKRGFLVSLSGLPGVGKSSIARLLAAEIGAIWLRIDSIESALRSSGVVDGDMKDASYRAAYAVAADNLALGHRVIADCVNPWMLTRDAWRDVALTADAELLELEVICTDRDAHRHRVEARIIEADGGRGPGWQEVVARDYRPWTRPVLVVETAGRRVCDCAADIRHILAL
ncbi:AAA family ATPase [Afifella marina]|uniref:AAA domain-containing protein n=1 Tax=Afifella marina DSM 2698 TaxID=1120955 RepID=A0A1G5P814_AFIMA|nr:AAA family ATPase [Afifella marina]SCZ45697.1 AAA domain-containing protein [Afifella marina DSM 2698]